MKAILLLPSLGIGGVELHVTELAEHLAPRGIGIVVVSDGGPLATRIEAAGARHVTMPVRRKSPVSLAAIPRLRRLILREAPDIVHAHSRLPAWIARAALATIPARVRPRLVTTLHGLNSVSRYSAIMTRGRPVIAVSRTVAEYALTHYPALRDTPPIIIRGSVDTDRFNPAARPDAAWVAAFEAEFPQTKGKRLIALPGRLTRLKGHADAIEALAGAQDTSLCLLFVGEVAPGKERYASELAETATARGVADRVVFIGARGDLPTLMAHCEATLSLSTKPESFGRVVAESLAVGTPVLGYDRGGVGEILNDAYPQGCLPVGDVQALTEALDHGALPPPPPLPAPVYGKDREMTEIMALYLTLER